MRALTLGEVVECWLLGIVGTTICTLGFWAIWHLLMNYHLSDPLLGVFSTIVLFVTVNDLKLRKQLGEDD